MSNTGGITVKQIHILYVEKTLPMTVEKLPGIKKLKNRDISKNQIFFLLCMWPCPLQNQLDGYIFFLFNLTVKFTPMTLYGFIIVLIFVDYYQCKTTTQSYSSRTLSNSLLTLICVRIGNFPALTDMLQSFKANEPKLGLLNMRASETPESEERVSILGCWYNLHCGV